MMMKRYSLLCVVCMAFIACQKQDIQLPDFDVEVKSAEVLEGEEVEFVFSGNPEFISFYSGEWGNDYAYREGRIEDSEIMVSFQSLIIDNRVPASTQDDQLSVLISKNFNGNQNIADVEAAEWHDITSDFRIVSLSDDNNTWVESGKVNISPYIVEGEPVYIAFRYLTLPRSTHGVAPNFLRVNNFLLESIAGSGERATLATHASVGITPPKDLVRSATYTPGRGNLQPTFINFFGNISPGQDDVTTVAWAITNPFTIEKTINFGMDKAISIKTLISPKVTTYTHKYEKPGKYQVVFVAKNANTNDEKEVIKQLEIIVKPKI